MFYFSIERYVSSKELRLVNDSPDRFYDISPSCKVLHCTVHSEAE